MSKRHNNNNADDEFFMEFVVDSADRGGGGGGGNNILKAPIRVNVEELARTGGVTTINTTGADGQTRQATLMMPDHKLPPTAPSAAAADRDRKSNSEQAAVAAAAQRDPNNSQTMTFIRREEQLDAVEGRRSFVAADLEELELPPPSRQQQQQADGEDDDDGDDDGGGRGGGDQHKQGGGGRQPQGAPIVKHRPNLRCCAADNKRAFVPPPVRRFAYAGYTNAVVGGDGVRRLVIQGGLSKVSVEHECYEYSLNGQRWRRLECKAEQYTPAGIPIMPLARHSHSASVLLEAGQGGCPYLVIYGGVGLGGCVVPPDGLQNRHSRAVFEELFGCDAETFARQNSKGSASATQQQQQQHVLSVLDIIQGGDDGSAAAATNAVATSGSSAGAVAQVGVLDEIHELNLKTRTWRRIQVAAGSVRPPHLCEHTAVMFGNRSVIFGGTTLEMLPAEGKLLHMIEAVRSKNQYGGRSRDYIFSTRAVEPAPLGRSRHSAVACAPDVMAVFGGVNAAGDYMGDLWLLNGAATSEEPVWVQVPLTQGSGSSQGASSNALAASQSSAINPSNGGGSGEGTVTGRAGHSAAMSHGHRMLVVGGQTSERGNVSSVLEIQLGPVLIDGAAEAVCRHVRVEGDSLPRFAFGAITGAGDGNSIVAFGGSKTWKEDKKKLRMLKNPSPEELERLHGPDRFYEGLSNSVYVCTFPEIPPPPGGWKRAGDEESDDGSVVSSDSNMGGGEWRPKEPFVPKTFKNMVDDQIKKYNYMWEQVTEKQNKIDGDARVYASARIFVDKKTAVEILEAMDEAMEWVANLSDDQFPAGLDMVDERKKARDNELRTGLSQAKMQCGLSESGKSKQQLNYHQIEEHLRKCHSGLKRLHEMIEMSTATQAAVAWQKGEHSEWLEEAGVKLRDVDKLVRGAKKAVVDASLKRLEIAEQKSRLLHKQMVKKAEDEDRELMSKTAMQFVLEERARAAPRFRGQIRSTSKSRASSSNNRNQSSSSSGSDDGDGDNNNDGTYRRKKKNINKFRYQTVKKVRTYPTPEYGEQIPDLTITLIENDRKVHARLVRVCRNEISSLEASLVKLPDSVTKPQQGEGETEPPVNPYDAVNNLKEQYRAQVDVIEADILNPPPAGTTATTTTTTTTTNTTATSNTTGSSALSSSSSSSAAAAAASSQQQQQQQQQGGGEEQTLKSLVMLRHSKDLVDIAGKLKAKAIEAAAPNLMGKTLVNEIRDTVENMDQMSKSFRQYWHLTFLSRGYEHGGSGVDWTVQNARNKKGSPSSSQQRGGRSTSPRGGGASRGGVRTASAVSRSGSAAAARPGSAMAAAGGGARASSSSRSVSNSGRSTVRQPSPRPSSAVNSNNSTTRRGAAAAAAAAAAAPGALPPRGPATQPQPQQQPQPTQSQAQSQHQVRIAALPPGYQQQPQQQQQQPFSTATSTVPGQQQQHQQQQVQFAAINETLLRTGIADSANTSTAAQPHDQPQAAAAVAVAPVESDRAAAQNDENASGWSIVNGQQQQQQQFASGGTANTPTLSGSAQMHWIQPSAGAVAGAAPPSFAAQQQPVPAPAQQQSSPVVPSPVMTQQQINVAQQQLSSAATAGGGGGGSDVRRASVGSAASRASVGSNDPLFKGKKLTPGERRILEARGGRK